MKSEKDIVKLEINSRDHVRITTILCTRLHATTTMEMFAQSFDSNYLDISGTLPCPDRNEIQITLQTDTIGLISITELNAQ